MTGASVIIGPETPGDEAGIDAVLRSAFDGPGEAQLVTALRAAGDLLTCSHVAREGDRVVGHVAMSPVQVDGATGCLALAPLAVIPDRQRRGIGAELARSALRACAASRARSVFVLGDPRYYPRFGFLPATPRGFWFRTPGDQPAFMLTELVAGALDDASGEVRYAAPFEGV